jgi:pimeloyl-ACP methyl ester carboxylesterase
MAAGELPEAPDPLDDRDLRGLAAPALVVAGEHDMPDFHAGADAWAAELPDARRVTMPDAGHLAPLEQPEAFGELLLGFLREVAARAQPPGPS